MIDCSKNIDLVRVSDLLGEHFYVPSYQRGYRWTTRQVTDLLNDLRDFIRNTSNGSKYYCLQPLVLKPLDKEEATKKGLDNNLWYEVIDGQQRLTTIKILYSYFTKKHCIFEDEDDWKSSMMKICYETRKETGDFLDALSGEAVSVADDSNDYQDIFFIKNAYRVIDDWFNTNFDSSSRTTFRRKMASTLASISAEDIGEDGDEGKPIKFIIYLDNSTPNPIDVFERINIGKIQLTNAELIRAIFLLRSNYKSQEFLNNELALLQKQYEIANEWDAIEHSLQDDKFWYFIGNSNEYKHSRIGFIFDLIYFKVKRVPPNNIDDYETFRFFYEMVNSKDNPKNIIDLWDETKRYFDDLMDWFNDKELYHYIGWLSKTNKSIYIETLHSNYLDCETITSFKERVMRNIKTNLNVKCRIAKGPNGTVTGVDFVGINYASKKELLRNFYLLLNIQQIINNGNDANSKFPFDSYMKEKWNIEHIDSHTENELKTTDEKNDWLNVALECLSEEELRIYNSSINEQDSFESKRAAIRELIGESLIENDEETKNSVGNLTLLDEKTNKSYGNQIFLKKRNIIIEKDKNGSFVLPATRNAFLKYFSLRPTSLKWTRTDINDYEIYIFNQLKPFLSIEEELAGE